jgi:hypothetical protein
MREVEKRYAIPVLKPPDIEDNGASVKAISKRDPHFWVVWY